MKYLVVTLLLTRCASILCYKAAVYEHDVIFPTDRTTILSRDQALSEMNKNLQVYETQCKLAAKQGVQIIVFPEYGIYGLSWTRKALAPYLEFIPDPLEQSWNPCVTPGLYNNTEVQHTLSCIAKNSSLFLVVNFGAKQPCDSLLDHACPSDGYYSYSTNLVYDPSGKFIARYFKYNLKDYERSYLNRPKHIDYTVFDTPFGKFGTVTSYDIMYYDPVEPLINKLGVTNIVYPTAWQDELPLFSAIEFHSSFSEGSHITLLAANLHIPSNEYHGSGIYWPVGTGIGGVYCYNSTKESGGELLITNFTRGMDFSDQKLKMKTVAKERYGNGTKKYRNKFQQDTTSISVKRIEKVIKKEINHDIYNILPLPSKSYGSFNVCHGKFCCEADYEGIFDNTLYALAAFDGIHTYDGVYYLQICAFIRCANDSVESCGEPATGSNGEMSKMSFIGSFTSDRIFPEVLVSYDDSYELSTMTWLYQDAIIIDAGLPGVPISVAMVGRNYTRDHLN